MRKRYRVEAFLLEPTLDEDQLEELIRESVEAQGVKVESVIVYEVML
jgi:hypothetical protein